MFLRGELEGLNGKLVIGYVWYVIVGGSEVVNV